jgi:hypothetical protein
MQPFTIWCAIKPNALFDETGITVQLRWKMEIYSRDMEGKDRLQYQVCRPSDSHTSNQMH